MRHRFALKTNEPREARCSVRVRDLRPVRRSARSRRDVLLYGAPRTAPQRARGVATLDDPAPGAVPVPRQAAGKYDIYRYALRWGFFILP